MMISVFLSIDRTIAPDDIMIATLIPNRTKPHELLRR